MGEHIVLDTLQGIDGRIPADARVDCRERRFGIVALQRDFYHVGIGPPTACVVIDARDAIPEADDLYGIAFFEIAGQRRKQWILSNSGKGGNEGNCEHGVSA